MNALAKVHTHARAIREALLRPSLCGIEMKGKAFEERALTRLWSDIAKDNAEFRPHRDEWMRIVKGER